MSDVRRIIIHELANKVSALRSAAEADPDCFDRDMLLTIDSIDLLLKYLLDTELIERLRRSEKREVKLGKVLKDVISELDLMADLREVNVEIESCDLKLLTNEFVLRRIIYNLLHNAVKFSPKGGTVKIVCDADEKGVELRIINDVVEDKERLKGTGFGVSLTKELATWLGAQLEVKNRGNTFEAVLKISQN